MKSLIPPDSGRYLGVGIELATAFFLGMALGYWIDKKMARFPIFTIIGTLLGISLGFYNLFKRLKDTK